MSFFSVFKSKSGPKHIYAQEHKLYCYINTLSLFSQTDGTSSIQFKIPKNLIQNVINKAVADRDWKRLHLLFLGGGGEKKYKNGSGGLATGCDASSVPLEEVIRNDLPILGKFINILLDHKANVTSGVSASTSELPKVKESFSKTQLNPKNNFSCIFARGISKSKTVKRD